MDLGLGSGGTVDGGRQSIGVAVIHSVDPEVRRDAVEDEPPFEAAFLLDAVADLDVLASGKLGKGGRDSSSETFC